MWSQKLNTHYEQQHILTVPTWYALKRWETYKGVWHSPWPERYGLSFKGAITIKLIYGFICFSNIFLLCSGQLKCLILFVGVTPAWMLELAVTAGLEHIPETAGWRKKYTWTYIPRGCACAWIGVKITGSLWHSRFGDAPSSLKGH